MDNNKKRPDKIKILLKLINVAVVVVFVATFSLYMLLAVRPKTSATESRKLATFPDFSFSTLFSGKYFNDIIYWYTDAAPNRDDMKKATVLMREKFGVTNTSDIIIVGPDVPGSDSSKDERPSEDEHPSKDDHSDTSVPEESGDTSKDQSKDESSNTSTDTSKPPVDDDEFVSNNILIIGTRACEMFGGTYDAAKEFAMAVNAYKKDLGASVNVYTMMIPSAGAFYMPPKVYDQYGGKQLDKLAYAQEKLDGVIPIDVFKALESHKGEDIYYRTDHHWTPLGGYYAAEALAKAANLPFVPLSDYKKNGKYDSNGKPLPYLGSLYGLTQQAVLLKNPEEFKWYEYQGGYTIEFYSFDYKKLLKTRDNAFLTVSDSNTSAWYMTFMDGDNYSIKIKTNVKNGRKAIVFKDSYGNALVPMMLSSFEEIYTVDIRKFPLNAIKFIKDNGITDVVFGVCSYTVCGTNRKYINSMRTQNG